MDKLKVALIGAGQIARVSHIPAYLGMDNVEIVGISDVNEEAAKNLSEEFKIPFFTSDHKQLLERCKPDAVSVCVPNKFHYPIVMDALNSGCNVMCEKPPAISAEEAAKMAEAARTKSLILTYDFHFRYGDNVSLMKKKIESNEFGKIYFSRVKWLRRAGVPGWGNFINRDLQGGGPLIDIGAHMLDLALFLLNYPDISYVCASASNRIGTKARKGFMGEWNPEKYTVEDGVFGMLFFKDGTSLQLESTFALNMKEKDVRAVELYGDKAGGSLFPMELYEGEQGHYANISYPPNDGKDLHTIALMNFVNSCFNKETVVVTAEQGAYVQKVIQALYQSAETNCPVEM